MKTGSMLTKFEPTTPLFQRSAQKQIFCQLISQTVVSSQCPPPKSASSHPDPCSWPQNLGDFNPFLESISFPDPFHFYLPGMFSWLVPQADVQRNSRRLGNPTVPLLGLTSHGKLESLYSHHCCYWTANGVPLPVPLGKLQRQRFGEKKRRSLYFKSYTIFKNPKKI